MRKNIDTTSKDKWGVGKSFQGLTLATGDRWQKTKISCGLENQHKQYKQMDRRRWQCLHGSTLAFVQSDLVKSTSSSKRDFSAKLLANLLCMMTLRSNLFFKVRWWHHSRARCPTAHWLKDNVKAAEGCPTAYLLSWRLSNSLFFKRTSQCRWGPFCLKFNVVRVNHHPDFNHSNLVSQSLWFQLFNPMQRWEQASQ